MTRALNMREIAHVTQLEKALSAYKRDLLDGCPIMSGASYIAVLNASYDLLEVEAIYDRAGEVRTKMEADQPDPRDVRPGMARRDPAVAGLGYGL